MAKNASFNKTYTIEVKGITTNGFADDLIDQILHVTVQAIDIQHKQVDISISVKDNKNGEPNQLEQKEKR
jgi:hypothetical protein